MTDTPMEKAQIAGGCVNDEQCVHKHNPEHCDTCSIKHEAGIHTYLSALATASDKEVARGVVRKHGRA
jgi:hypothetical protein